MAFRRGKETGISGTGRAKKSWQSGLKQEELWYFRSKYRKALANTVRLFFPESDLDCDPEILVFERFCNKPGGVGLCCPDDGLLVTLRSKID